MHKCGTTYKEIVYFSERISQWRGLEPPLEHWATKRVWAKWAELKPGDYEKSTIRAVLAACDADLARDGVAPFFVKVALEKWLTIREEVGGRRSTGHRVNEAFAWRLKQQFERFLVSYNRRVRKQSKRRSVMNYNFIIRRLLDLNGRGELGVDLPPLKTKAKQAKLVEMWHEACIDLQWPYVNNDEIIFS